MFGLGGIPTDRRRLFCGDRRSNENAAASRRRHSGGRITSEGETSGVGGGGHFLAVLIELVELAQQEFAGTIVRHAGEARVEIRIEEERDRIARAAGTVDHAVQWRDEIAAGDLR